MSHISTFVSRRFEELHALFNASGYLLDFSERELSRWEDDPPLGRARACSYAATPTNNLRDHADR